MSDNDIEVLEELGEAESLDQDDAAEIIDVLDEADSSGPPEMETESLHFSATSNPYVNSFFPVLFIDRRMKILFANNACHNLFTNFFEISGRHFIDVFGKSFGIDEVRKIHNLLLEEKENCFWKGEVHIKTRSIASVQIKVYIFPADISVIKPSEFVVMFDDITEENKKLTRATFLSLLEASKLKDNDTGNHIIRVNYFSKRMAEELFGCKNTKYNRIDADFIDNIGFLASMHDVGKIGTPDDILNKKGPLSEWEWTVMREHTKNGAFILSTYPNPMAKEIALSHHERWDGDGYPYQLSGDMIPLSARIITIADAYDALRMERSYKPALPHKETVIKMTKASDGHFDPFLLEVFEKIESDFEIIFNQNQDIRK